MTVFSNTKLFVKWFLWKLESLNKNTKKRYFFQSVLRVLVNLRETPNCICETKRVPLKDDERYLSEMQLNFQKQSNPNPRNIKLVENIVELNSTTNPLQPKQFPQQTFMLDQMLQKASDGGLIDVLPSSVEGELSLTKVKPLKRSSAGFAFYIILCLLTGGIFYVISVIWPKIYERMVFNNVKNPFDASHVLAISINDEEFYERLQLHQAQISKSQNVVYFINRFMKYIYDESRNSFQALEYELEGKRVGDITLAQPQNEQAIPELLSYYGHSFIDIIIPGYHQFFATELLRPINFLLYFGLIIWILELRITFFAVTFASTLIILVIICFFVRRTKQQLREACLHDVTIEVERSNGKSKVSSKDIVPGDIIHINQSLRIPFDCIILEGQLQVNEANITGEAIPVSKIPLSAKSNEEFRFNSQITHILFEGTSIIQLEDGAAKLMVIRAGYSSYKGQIVRSLLHPKPVDKKIYIQGIKFVLAMLALAYIAYFATLYKLIEIEMLTKDKIYRFFDVLIYCAPPGAPLLINAVIFFSLIRLRRSKIFGSDPSKPIQAGRIKTICFDKTGTLTESSVNIQGYQLPYSADKNQIIKDGDKKSILYKLLSICHQTTVTQNGELSGDPIDVEMVKFSGWKVGHDNERKQNYSEYNDGGMIKIYTQSINEFHSEYQSMSVVTQEESNGQKQNANLFIKGSPEVVLQKCSTSSEEKKKLKSQFDSLASQGYRVLGVAYKTVPHQELEAFLQKERQDQEVNLQFLGFVIFKNNLKSDTAYVIQQLIDTGVKIKIISGDSPITTLRVAQEANIISSQVDTILIDWVSKTTSQLTITKYTSGQNGEFELTPSSLDLTQKDQFNSLIQYCEQSISGLINICVTGNAHTFFEGLIRRHGDNFLSAESDIPRVNKNEKTVAQNLRNLYKLIVLSSQLFARTSPSQKANVVKIIKENGEIVCMVGDGTNDSPAIREADVGISFADADGQFSAPYISQNPSLDCVLKIILEGRVSLGISLEIFIGYIQVSIIRFISFQSLSYFYSGFGDFQMSWQAYVSGFVIVYFFLGFSGPLRDIKKCYINDNFFSAQYIISSISGFVCQSVSIIVGLAALKASSIYVEVMGFDTDKKFMFECQPNTIIFMFTLIHYFYVHICNNIGAPIKQPWFKNYIVLVLMLAQFIYGLVITLTPKAYIKALKLVDLDDNSLRVGLFFIFNGFGLLQVLIEKILIQNFILKYHERQAQKKYSEKYSNMISNLKNDANVIYSS